MAVLIRISSKAREGPLNQSYFRQDAKTLRVNHVLEAVPEPLERRNNQTGVQHQYDCLNQMYDGHGIADEPYKDGDPSEHGIYQTLKTALYLYTIHLHSHLVPAGLEDTLLRTQGPDGGFHTGYDQAGTYAGTLENAETSSIVMITLSSIASIIPSWVLFTGITALIAGAATILTVLALDDSKNREARTVKHSNHGVI